MNELERNVLEMIGENTSSPDVFTDDSTGMALIRSSLNDAIEELCMVTGSVRRTYKQPVRDDANFYRFSFNSERLAWVAGIWVYTIKRRLEQTDLRALAMENPNWLQDTGSPRKYFLVGTKYFGVWPRSSSASDLFEIKCAVVPDRYTLDTDRIKLRESFKEAATMYAVGEFFASRGDAKQAQYHHEEYLKILSPYIGYTKSPERVYGLGSNIREAASVYS